MGKLIKNKIKGEAKPFKNEPKGKISKSKSLKTKRKVFTASLPVHQEETLNTQSDFEVSLISNGEDEFKTNVFNVEENSVRSGIRGLFKLIETYKSKKNNKLFDDELPIFLQVSCIRVSKCPVRTTRLHLKNSLYRDASEVCLITANLRDEPRKEHDKTIEHYENVLLSKGVKNIKTIMPLHQLKTEYDQYELKRKLITQYDVFLVEGKVSKNVAHLLGKIFKEKRKLPIPVKLHVPKLKEHLENALSKTLMNIHPNGDNFIAQVAHTEMSEEEIYENIISTLEDLAKVFPGGKENVRAVHLKSSSTISIPIYYSLKKACDVPVPIVRSRRPKAFKSVVGTLSTSLNASVLIDPSGNITVSKSAKYSEDEEVGNEFAGRYVTINKEYNQHATKNNKKLTKQRSGKVVKTNGGNSNGKRSQNKRPLQKVIRKKGDKNSKA